MGEKKNTDRGRIVNTSNAPRIEASAIYPMNGFNKTSENLRNIEIYERIVARCADGIIVFIWILISSIRVKPNPPANITNSNTVTICGYTTTINNAHPVIKAVNRMNDLVDPKIFSKNEN